MSENNTIKLYILIYNDFNNNFLQNIPQLTIKE